MYITDNPIEDFNRYQYDLERRLNFYPACDCCGEKIQDDYLYQIDSEIICEECLLNFRKSTDDFIIDKYSCL